MQRLLVFAAGFFVVAGCQEAGRSLVLVPDASSGRDASAGTDAGPPPNDAGRVDTGGLILPACPPGVDFVELPLPEVSDVFGRQRIIALSSGLVFEDGSPSQIRDWRWDGRLNTIEGYQAIAAVEDATLSAARDEFVFVGDGRTRRFAGRDIRDVNLQIVLGQPYGAEFIQAQFVAWPSDRPDGVAVNIYDRDRHHRTIENVILGPAVSATHVAWLNPDPTSMSDWIWVVEDQRTEQRLTTTVAQYGFGRNRSLRVTDTEAYAFHPGSDARPVLDVWEFTKSPNPVEVPSDLFGSCQFLAGAASILLCGGATGTSMHRVTPTGVSLIDTGGQFSLEGSQSKGRVLFFETDGFNQTADVPGRVVVLDTETGARLELTETFTIPRAAYLSTSFTDDVAVWSLNKDDTTQWGAVRLCRQ